jgi:hypothetical protein
MTNVKKCLLRLNSFWILPTLAIIALIVAPAGSAYAQDRPYHEVPNWAQLPTGRAWGHVIGIEVDSHDNVWAFDRCGGLDCVGSDLAPLLEFDPSGKLLKSLGAGMFLFPTGLFIDKNDHDNIWVTERSGQNGRGCQVVKLSPNGKVLLRLGKAGVCQEGQDSFNAPENVVVAPNGDIFVADGSLGPAHEHGTPETLTSMYALSPTRGRTLRIVKFSKDGKFIKAWGKEGSGPGEFRSIRGLALDGRGRLFVGDRGNNRMEIFDQDGKFLEEWKQFGQPTGIYITATGTLYVSDGSSDEKSNPGFEQGIRIGSVKDGVVKAFIPEEVLPDGLPSATIGVAADSKGNVYEVEGHMKTMRKYAKN